MYVDDFLILSDAQAITAAADSTNMIDQGVSGGRDLGNGSPLFLVICVTVAMTDSGSDSTVTVALQGDTTSTMSPDATADIFTIPAVSAAGSVYVIPLPIGSAPMGKRYINIKYTPNNGNLSAGSFSAFITTTPQKAVIYAKGYTIS